MHWPKSDCEHIIQYCNTLLRCSDVKEVFEIVRALRGKEKKRFECITISKIFKPDCDGNILIIYNWMNQNLSKRSNRKLWIRRIRLLHEINTFTNPFKVYLHFKFAIIRLLRILYDVVYVLYKKKCNINLKLMHIGSRYFLFFFFRVVFDIFIVFCWWNGWEIAEAIFFNAPSASVS